MGAVRSDRDMLAWSGPRRSPQPVRQPSAVILPSAIRTAKRSLNPSQEVAVAHTFSCKLTNGLWWCVRGGDPTSDRRAYDVKPAHLGE